ncbi:hypothetical protein AAD001_01545 [Colwelliaceae bacterium 6471]
MSPKLERWALIRDAFVFQVKLGLDALRDLLLSPFSVLSVIVDIVRNPTVQDSYFYRLMKLGHKSDHWINLFGTRKPSETSSNQIEQCLDEQDLTVNQSEDDNVDQLFIRVEALLKEQHSKGTLTASAKSTIDRYLNKIANKQPEQFDKQADKNE